MSNRTILKRSLAISLALGAAAVPASAEARVIVPGDAGLPGATTATTHSRASTTPDVAPATVSGQTAPTFSWDDAGIGAAGALVLLGAGGAATIAVRRRQTPGDALS